jgi:hypothetical protein
LAAGLSLVVAVALAQTADWNPIVPRPLEEAQLFLENQYEKPVTYEDPVWRWIGDSVAVGSQTDGPFGRLLWDRHLDLPDGVTAQENRKLDARLVQRVVDEYHRQNPGDTRFKVVESSLGLHILPAYVHDENGTLVEASSLLDTKITVPSAARMPSEHFRAICEAITNASGTRVDFGGQWLDQFLAPNGAVPRYGAETLLTAKEKEPYSFQWAASGVPAREALIGLIESSSTTLTWALLCRPSLKPQDRFCVLNLGPIQVTRADSDGKLVKKSLSYDRCGKCEFLKR